VAIGIDRQPIESTTIRMKITVTEPNTYNKKDKYGH
jgi:hypothetical protein